MRHIGPIKLSLLVSAMVLLGLARNAAADTIETKNGARLVGKVVSIDGTTVVLETGYAGALKIKQKEVTSITTDKPFNVRLSSGTVLRGTLAGMGNGSILLNGTDGSITTTVENLAATWAPDGIDPAVAALMRSWAYEVAVDVAGKTGNKEQLGTMFSARATLKTPQDTLEFYSAYDRQVSEGEKSADQFKAGVDYQNNFAGRYSWYVRDEGGFDRVKNIELYNIAALGFGYDFIKQPKHTLTGRTGLSFRYESYKADPVLAETLFNQGRTLEEARRLATKESIKAAGLDIGFKHDWELGRWKLANQITYNPLFEDVANYRILHESYFEIPTAAPAWKLRLGVGNDYTSKPSPGTKRLDTTYFTRLVLNWK